MIILQGLQRESQFQTSLFQFLERQVLLLHLLDLRLQVVGTDALRQSHITLISVVAHPVVAPVKRDLRDGRHRHHHFDAVQLRVQGDVLVDTSDGQGPAASLVVVHLLPQDVATQLLRYRLRNQTVVHPTERLLGIASHDTEGKHVEETTVHKGIVHTNALVVVRHQRHTPCNSRVACGSLHLRTVTVKGRSDGPCRLWIVFKLALADDVLADDVGAMA